MALAPVYSVLVFELDQLLAFHHLCALHYLVCELVDHYIGGGVRGVTGLRAHTALGWSQFLFSVGMAFGSSQFDPIFLEMLR